MPESLQIRIHGDASLPTVVYLPGLHGDWTLVGGFRTALGQKVRFVEVTYPRTLTWSLADYAAGVEEELARNSVRQGWLLGESFGSQVAWHMVARRFFLTEGIILAGGFARHPARWAVRIAEWLCGGLPLTLLTLILFSYGRVARFRFRPSSESLADLSEFIARRTELDRQAAKHRLRLVAGSNPNPIVRDLQLPLFCLSGLFDPIVPWFLVNRDLRRHCAALREYKIVPCADHNVLGTAPRVAAVQVARWIGVQCSCKPN
jgi:pimeloyl-ACP methyl ester carboxylesterase